MTMSMTIADKSSCRGMIAYQLNISTQSIPHAWVSELSQARNLSRVASHCPDHAIIVDHQHKYHIISILL